MRLTTSRECLLEEITLGAKMSDETPQIKNIRHDDGVSSARPHGVRFLPARMWQVRHFLVKHELGSLYNLL